MAVYMFYTLSAPLILKAIAFVRWVVTHSLADYNFHVYCPDVIIQQHFSWYLIMSVQSGTFKTLLSVHPASPVQHTKTGPWRGIYSKKINNVDYASLSISHPFKVWQ